MTLPAVHDGLINDPLSKFPRSQTKMRFYPHIALFFLIAQLPVTNVKGEALCTYKMPTPSCQPLYFDSFGDIACFAPCQVGL